MYIENIDLGTLPINKKYNFSAIIRNDKTFPITITKIKVGCTSCTEASIVKNDIQSNEDVIMKVAYTPGSIGMHDKMIRVYYMENNIPLECVFTFKATVV